MHWGLPMILSAWITLVDALDKGISGLQWDPQFPQEITIRKINDHKSSSKFKNNPGSELLLRHLVAILNKSVIFP